MQKYKTSEPNRRKVGDLEFDEQFLDMTPKG